ncbi:MAG TPA: lycopene cyclase domain-containing protein [Ohtaekwangia sp.]|nr:lycopene cyclase domain-containing protein [Ohtaekwangia sp.]
MNPKYLYLTIDILTILVPLLFSFYPKAPFYKRWKYLWVAILVPGVIFLLWDEVFTQAGIWGFNPAYVSGIYIGTLPIEEILFFICIPYACVFTYFALNHLIEKDHLFPHHELISSVLILLLLVLGLYHFEKWYTGITFVALGLIMAYQMLKMRPRYMGRFYFAFFILLIPFFIVNGFLTGLFGHQIVWYNNAHTLGVRLGTIPLEDVFYAMLLLLLNVGIFEWLQERYENR